jgi:trans-aconitate methyltransferase
VDRLLAMFDLALAGTETVVEIGCAPGRLTRALSPRAARVVALDVSEEMLAGARTQNGG